MCTCPTARVRPSWSFLHIYLRGFCVAAFKQAFLLLLSTFWPGAPHHQTFCCSPFPSIFSAKAGVPDHPLGSLAGGFSGKRPSSDAGDAGDRSLFHVRFGCPCPHGQAAGGRSPCSRRSMCGTMGYQPCVAGLPLGSLSPSAGRSPGKGL